MLSDPTMRLHERVRSFVVETFYVEAGALGDDDSLLGRGIIDSTGVLDVIEFLERDLGVIVEDSEMRPENLDSISLIAAFAEKKLAAQPLRKPEKGNLAV